MGNNIVTMGLTDVLDYSVSGFAPMSRFFVGDNEPSVSL
jgi:hypothetical protein